MKILLFGSAFNPPHRGHLNILTAAINHSKPDLCLLVPTGRPAHKKLVFCPTGARLLMVGAFAAELPCRASVLDFELHRKTKSYTIETIEHIKRLYDGVKIELLIGSDMLLYFHKWHRYRDILSQVTLLVAARDKKHLDDMRLATKKLRLLGADIKTLTYDPIVQSSTQIRRNIQYGKVYDSEIPPKVADIIKEHNLYAPPKLSELATFVKGRLSQKRFNHTLAVEKMARALAERYDVDMYSARAAALLHDSQKEAPFEKLLQSAEKNGIIPMWHKKPRNVWHGYVAAEYAETELNILNQDIINAIRYHSTGRADMSMLEMLIFVADMVSEDRTFDGVERLRRLAFTDIKACLLQCLITNVDMLREDGEAVDEDSLKAIEFLKGVHDS